MLPVAKCLAGSLHMIHSIQPIPYLCEVIVRLMAGLLKVDKRLQHLNEARVER